MTLLPLGSNMNRELVFDVYAATRPKTEALAVQQHLGEISLRAGKVEMEKEAHTCIDILIDR